MIKGNFARSITTTESPSASRLKRVERGIWQRRFWEHLIRNEDDFRKHVDYIHWNPVKHGWTRKVADWPHSSFHAYLRKGMYEKTWGGLAIADVKAGELNG